MSAGRPTTKMYYNALGQLDGLVTALEARAVWCHHTFGPAALVTHRHVSDAESARKARATLAEALGADEGHAPSSEFLDIAVLREVDHDWIADSGGLGGGVAPRPTEPETNATEEEAMSAHTTTSDSTPAGTGDLSREVREGVDRLRRFHADLLLPQALGASEYTILHDMLGDLLESGADDHEAIAALREITDWADALVHELENYR